MSHFVTIVLVAHDREEGVPDEEQARELVGPLLAPYDENIEAPRHRETCYCVGLAAHKAAREAAEDKVGTIAVVCDLHI